MKTLLTALAASTLLVAPAIAQSQGDATGNGQQGQTSQDMQSGATSGNGQTAGTGKAAQDDTQATGCAARRQAEERRDGRPADAASLASMAEVETALSEAGLREIAVQEASYVVEATAPNDDCVVMVIDTSTRAEADRRGEPGEGKRERMSRESENLAGELEAAGYSDIRVLDAAFAATAALPGGEPVMLMVDGRARTGGKADDGGAASQ